MHEAAAQCRQADEYEAAQARGEMQGHGGARNFKIPTGNLEKAKAAEAGLTLKVLHEARKVRDAEKASPGT
jgi:hypothetical protein